MTVTLTLHQNMGQNPPWVNPNLWAGDANGNPLTPTAGTGCYLWATVANTGDEDTNVVVQYYWGNPSLAMIYGNLVVVGYGGGYVSAGGSENIVCNTQWVPVYVNQGHECLVAVAGALYDPPPPTQPNDIIDANDAQVAQRNITIVNPSAGATQASHRFALPAVPGLAAGDGIVRATRAAIGDHAEMLAKQGVTQPPEEASGLDDFYLAPAAHAGAPEAPPINLGKEFAVAPGVHHDLALVIPLDDGGGGALFFVEYVVRGTCVGGIGVLVAR